MTATPALENHFTVTETWEIMLRAAGTRRARACAGWRWYMTAPAIQDLLLDVPTINVDGKEVVAGCAFQTQGDATLVTGVLLWGFPVHLVAGSKAIVYFGQGVL